MSQEIETTFRLNDAEYEFDIRDADYADKFEHAVANLDAGEKKLPKDGKTSDLIRAHCGLIKSFFDDCFGEGGGVAVCTEKNNISTHYEAYEKFLDFVRRQKNYITDKGNTFRQYSNRNQRRHPQNPGQNKKNFYVNRP